ncbi:MAG: rod shape-determining protein RodA [Christensenellaceae bacterium]|jgi:rod shape determining protein RodA|nr:rod shape-determining protein RodA [Christensenellaceae bacterium]
MLFKKNNGYFLDRLRGRFDGLLFLLVLALSILGVMLIANATADPYAQSEGSGIASRLVGLLTRSAGLQLTWVGVGLAAFFLVYLLFDYRIYGEFAIPIYIAANLLLIAVLFLPKVRGIGAFMTWMSDRTFQPSEVCKVAIIITLARHLSSKNGRISSVKEFLPFLLHFALPFGIIILQDDYGTALVFLAIFVGMLFVSGIDLRIFLGFAAAGGLAAVGSWPFLSDFRRERVLNFLNPARDISGGGLHVYYSKIAVGSGQVSGKGLFVEGSISQLDFVPVKHSDFIFAVTAESVGFIGCLVILTLYLVLLMRLFYLSFKMLDPFGSYIIAGVGSMLLFHIIENVGMTIGIMPVTGIPLPFLSYGGSSLLANMLAMGLVFNVLRNQQRSLF